MHSFSFDLLANPPRIIIFNCPQDIRIVDEYVRKHKEVKINFCYSDNH